MVKYKDVKLQEDLLVRHCICIDALSGGLLGISRYSEREFLSVLGTCDRLAVHPPVAVTQSAVAEAPRGNS